VSDSRRPRRFSTLSQALIRLGTAYLVVMALLVCFPRLYPAGVAFLLRLGTGWLETTYAFEELDYDDRSISFRVTSSRLTRLTAAQREAGPRYSFEGYHHARALNVYPLVVFSLLWALPMPHPRRLAAMAVAVPLLLLAGTADTYLMVHWLGAESFLQVLASISTQIPDVPANTEALKVMEREFARLKTLKSFVSTGGRQFVAIILFLFAAASVYLVPYGPDGSMTSWHPRRMQNQDSVSPRLNHHDSRSPPDTSKSGQQ